MIKSPTPKICTKCKQLRNPDEYNKDPRASDGLCSSCKQCHHEYYMANRERQLARQSSPGSLERRRRNKRLKRERENPWRFDYYWAHTQKAKRCTKCGEIKLYSGYHNFSRGKDGKLPMCKDCANQHYSKWKCANREQVRANERARRKLPHRRAQMKAYLKAHPEQRKQITKRYYANNKDKYMEYSWQRRARVENAPGNGFTHKQFEEVKKRHGYICARCLRSESEVGKLTADHIVPISKGGTHEISNIQPLCKRCNRAKWTDTVRYEPLPLFTA